MSAVVVFFECFPKMLIGLFPTPALFCVLPFAERDGVFPPVSPDPSSCWAGQSVFEWNRKRDGLLIYFFGGLSHSEHSKLQKVWRVIETPNNLTFDTKKFTIT